jgi:ubiquinone/menaquinone biosynthesis C-methylase UbiE
MHSANGCCLMNGSSAVRFDFGRVAHRYDAWYQTPRGATYDRLEKEAIDKLLPSASNGGTLLEIGCGTGHWSRYFSNKGFAVTGVDVSERMIAVARQRNIAGGTFEVANAERLPFADGTFDVSAAVTTLEFVADPAVAVAEMARCAKKPGGTLIVGALNRLSAYNQSRQREAASVYASANLFSPVDLRNLLAPFGEPTILVAGFVPRRDSLVWLSPLLEWTGRLTGNERGAFLAAKVQL